LRQDAARLGEGLIHIPKRTGAQRVLPQLQLAEERLAQFAHGERGTQRIGMECHPCYQWLLKVMRPYLQQAPDVDMDVRQKFQFGGIDALQGFEIVLLVPPIRCSNRGYSLRRCLTMNILVAISDRPLAFKPHITPQHLAKETLITYPVLIERLDIYK
jgi:LysR family transcriptional regulator for metE and metH